MTIPVSSLPLATLPLTNNESVIADQSGSTVRIPVANLGGSTPVLAMTLTSNSSQYVFNGTDFSSWTATILKSSSEAAWNDTTKKVDLSKTGLYRVGIAGAILVNGGLWPGGSGGGNEWSHVGSAVSEATGPARSRYARWAVNSFGDCADPDAQWYDSFLVNATSLPATITPKVYGKRYSGSSYSGTFSASVTVQRV